MNINAFINSIVLTIMCIAYISIVSILNKRKSNIKNIKSNFFNNIFMAAYKNKFMFILNLLTLIVLVCGIIVNFICSIHILIYSQTIIALNCLCIMLFLLSIYIYLKK